MPGLLIAVNVLMTAPIQYRNDGVVPLAVAINYIAVHIHFKVVIGKCLEAPKASLVDGLMLVRVGKGTCDDNECSK